MTPTHRQAALTYVNRIRNASKREYARAWLLYSVNPEETPEPRRPEGLSFMGGQAVRHRIADLLSRPLEDLPRSIRLPRQALPGQGELPANLERDLRDDADDARTGREG